ncbi:hypothetical protein H5T52_06495 [Candidatus Bipolaricaulota bacterium]|nr:hypothetical protein [Candidatus Bipolaricaulota bacterium]
MKQVLQSYKTGERSLADVPPPALKSGHVLVQNVDAGTEKHMLEMAKKPGWQTLCATGPCKEDVCGQGVH